MTADAYLQHQSNKHSNIKTVPLMEILNYTKNPAVYVNRQPINISNKEEQCNEQINNKSLQQEAKAMEQCTKRADISHQKGGGIPSDNKSAFQGNEVKRTRSGCIVKKPDICSHCIIGRQSHKIGCKQRSPEDLYACTDI